MMNLDRTTLSDAQKYKYHIFSYICFLGFLDIHAIMKNSHVMKLEAKVYRETRDSDGKEEGGERGS